MVAVPPLKPANINARAAGSTEPVCANCVNFMEHENQPGTGWCRAHPPTVTLIPVQGPQGLIPMPKAAFVPVELMGWCGEHKRKLAS